MLSEDKFLEGELFGQRLYPFVNLIVIDKLLFIYSLLIFFLEVTKLVLKEDM